MYVIFVPLAALFAMSSTSKTYNDYYYQTFNSSKTTPSGIAAYRSALTLDWMMAEDFRQRELVSAYEQDPNFPSPVAKSECIAYNRPSASNVAKLMLEVLKNLEGDDGVLLANLVQALVRAKLLMLETTMFDNEPDFDALVKTPSVMIGEPHTTLPRIVAVLWMAITDPSTVKKHGWCTVSKMTSFIQANAPVDIAKHMRASDQIISRARFIMEEFIQHVTPLNMEKQSKNTANGPTQTTLKYESHLSPAIKYLYVDSSNKRPVRKHPEMQQQYHGSGVVKQKKPMTTTTSTTIEDLESMLNAYTGEGNEDIASQDKEDTENNQLIPEDVQTDRRVLEDIQKVKPLMLPPASSSHIHRIPKWIFVMLPYLLK